ncbi:HxsD-like protein [Candidatus Woesearchaeota archaeon]|nr:HxsD-like protein [Candidatus Woesearchaeota archaeon]
MITFKLNKKLYSEKAIMQTAEDYKEVCDTKIEKEKEYYKITLNLKSKDKELTEEIVKNEFCNYCLGMMKNL